MWLNSTGQNIELHLHVCVLVSCNVLDPDEVHGDVVQCFTGVQFNHISLYHLIFVPSIELWSRLIMRKEQIMAPDYEIERESTLHIHIRELKPCKKLMLRLTITNGWISRLFLNIIEGGVQRLIDRGLSG